MRASVVVPHHEDQANLDRVLAALAVQDVGPGALEVVVADDGSARPPSLGDRPYPVRLVRQADEGFRAAAARNLGAAGTHGDLVCFLDGDTVPEPGYLSALLAAADGCGPRALLVGRRRHADLTGLDAEDVVAWLTDRPHSPRPPVLGEPAWLTEAYDRSDDLRAADDESYRHVISAVLALTRPLLQAVRGFDERFTTYGGEDWELAHRCWLAGADFLHVRDAVAWHDGPDVAGRDVDRRRVLNDQALVLARRLPSPALRPAGVVFRIPWCAAEVNDIGWSPEQTLLAVASLLAGGADVGVWLTGGGAAGPGGVLAEDPRVHVGPVPAAVAERATWRVRVTTPLELTVPVAEVLGTAPGRLPGLDVQRTRDLARSGPVRTALPDGVVRRLGDDLDLGGLLRSRREGQGRLRVISPGTSAGVDTTASATSTSRRPPRRA